METFLNTFSGGGTNSFDDGGTGGDYEYNFSAVGGTGSSDLNSDSVLRMSPWGGLAEVGFTSLEQVFRNPRGDLGSGSGNTSSDDVDTDGSAPITGSSFMGGGNTSSDDSEPLLVGTNTTGDLNLDLNNPTTDGEPLVVGTNSSVKITVTGGGDSSSGGTEPVVVGTNNTIIGAENIPSNGSSVPPIVATNSTVEFIAGDDTSTSGTTSLVLGTNKTIGSEERVTDSNAPNNDANNYQWNLTSGVGGGAMAAGGDPLTGGGDSMTAGSNADFFRNLFGAGQAPNPDYTYDFGTQNSGGNFMPGGVDLSMSMGGASSSSGGDPMTFTPDSSFGGGMTNSNNSGADLPIAGTNNTIL